MEKLRLDAGEGRIRSMRRIRVFSSWFLCSASNAVYPCSTEAPDGASFFSSRSQSCPSCSLISFSLTSNALRRWANTSGV